MADVTSAIDKSIDNDNDSAILFLSVDPRDHKVICR